MSETITRYTLGRLQNLSKSDDQCVIDLCKSTRINTYEQKCLDILSIAIIPEALLYTNEQRTGDFYTMFDGRALSVMKKHNTRQNWQMYAPSYISYIPTFVYTTYELDVSQPKKTAPAVARSTRSAVSVSAPTSYSTTFLAPVITPTSYVFNTNTIINGCRGFYRKM